VSTGACTSEATGEAVLRDLTARAAEFLALPPAPALVPLQAQTNAMFFAARQVPPQAGVSISLAIAIAETAAGDSNVAFVAGVQPVAANAVGAAELIRANLSAHPLPAADAAIQAANAAIRAALAAAENPALAQNALNAAALADAAAAAADLAAHPAPPVLPPNPLPRAALTAAADAAIAAARVARDAANLQQPGPVQPVVLFQLLNQIADALDDALPPAGTEERARLMTEVFEEYLRMEQDWGTLVASLAPRCLGPGRTDLALAGRELLYGNPNYRVRDPKSLILPAPQPAARAAVQRLANDIGHLSNDVGRVAGYVDDAVQHARTLGGLLHGVVNVPGAGQVINDTLGAAREVTAEAVKAANDTGVINSVKQDVLKEIRDRTKAYHAAHPPQQPAAQNIQAPVGQAAQAQAPAQSPPWPYPARSWPVFVAIPELHEFAQKLDRVSNSRKEIRRAIQMKHITRDEWDALKQKAMVAGFNLHPHFIAAVEDALDESQQREIDPVATRAALATLYFKDR